MPKKIILLLSLALILSVAAFALWRMDRGSAPVVTPEPVPEEVSETPNESESIDTSDWKTYRNEELGIEFKYPEKLFYLNEEVIDDQIGVYSNSIPLELSLRLVQKGYSVDDYKHLIWIKLNGLKSDQENYYESNKVSVGVPVSFGSKKGTLYSSREMSLEKKNRYDLFVDEGICDPETFTIIFDEIKHADGDFRSYVHVGCEGKEMGKIYQLIYNSINFIK